MAVIFDKKVMGPSNNDAYMVSLACPTICLRRIALSFGKSLKNKFFGIFLSLVPRFNFVESLCRSEKA